MAVVTLIEFRLKYCWSATILRTCRPAVSGTPSLPTHWKVFQLPVLGTVTLPVTLTPSEIEVLRLKGAGNRDRDSGIRRGSGHGSSDPNRVQVEVLLVRDDFEDMPAGGERYAQLADPLEGVPAAGVGHGNAAGDVDAI